MWDNVDDPGGHGAKGNKPLTERLILHDVTFVRHPTESSSRTRRVEGRGSGGLPMRGHTDSGKRHE